ncbi:hypothetical protein ACTFIR_012823 [Dictyostelium discoideum]
MTSVYGDLILQDTARIIDKTGKLYGTDNFIFYLNSIRAYILDTENDSTPLSSSTISAGSFTLNKSKGFISLTFQPLIFPSLTGGFRGKMVGISFSNTSPYKLSNISSVVGSAITSDSKSSQISFGQVQAVSNSETPLNLRLKVTGLNGDPSGPSALQMLVIGCTFRVDEIL